MNKIKRTKLWFGDKVFINKSILLMSQRKYKKVEMDCNNRLEKYPENFGALYSMALNNYYEKNINNCFTLYLRLLSNYKVRFKIQKWFIQKLIEYQLYKKRSFDLVIERCTSLLEVTKKRRIKILLLKYACVANYEIKNYKEVINLCKELERRNFKDEHTKRIKSESEKKMTS